MKIKVMNIFLENVDGEGSERLIIQAHYTLVDPNNPSLSKVGTVNLPNSRSEVERLIVSAVGAVNEAEGSQYTPSQDLPEPESEEERELIEVLRKRLNEYPTPTAWVEAEYDARVKGDTTKRDALDAKVAEVKAKYPKPELVSDSMWSRVKAFFGF